MASDTKINWNAKLGQTFTSDQVARMHQICLCTKQLPFSRNLVSLLDQSDIYINQMFNIENFFTSKMTSNLSDNIEYEAAGSNVKVHAQ